MKSHPTYVKFYEASQTKKNRTEMDVISSENGIWVVSKFHG